MVSPAKQLFALLCIASATPALHSIAVAEGSIAVAEGSIAVAEGSIAVAEGSIAVAEGSIAVAEGSIAVAEGSEDRVCPEFAPGESLRGRVASDQIKEASGIAASHRNPGVYYVHNDNGDRARIFAIDEGGRDLGDLRARRCAPQRLGGYCRRPGPRRARNLHLCGRHRRQRFFVADGSRSTGCQSPR